MADAITLNIGNGAATLAYNEIVYSFTSNSGASNNLKNYTWKLMIIMYSPAFQTYILPYDAWKNHIFDAYVYVSTYDSKEHIAIVYSYNSGNVYIYDSAVLMLLN